MDNVNIITLEPERWQEYRALRLQSLQQDPTAFGSSYEESRLLPDTEWQKRLEVAQRKTETIILFAEVDGRLVGMMGAALLQPKKIAHIASIFGVYVEASMRGKGIGRRLMAALLAELDRKPQIEKLTLGVNTQNKVALSLYQKFGFEIIGTAQKELKIDGVYHDEYLMEKLMERDE